MQIVHVKHFATDTNRFISFEGAVVDVALDGAIVPAVDSGTVNTGFGCVAALRRWRVCICGVDGVGGVGGVGGDAVRLRCGAAARRGGAAARRSAVAPRCCGAAAVDAREPGWSVAAPPKGKKTRNVGLIKPPKRKKTRNVGLIKPRFGLLSGTSARQIARLETKPFQTLN